jgi:hypothetical protein
VNTHVKSIYHRTAAVALLTCLVPATGLTAQSAQPTLTGAQVDNIVRRSYQYVAMYNVNNKFALKHLAAQKPAGVAEENWLPINRADEGIGAILRIYVPDLAKMKTWAPPKADILK